MKKRYIYLSLLVLLVIGAWWLVKLVWLKPLNIEHFYARVLLETFWDNPEFLSRVRLFEPYGIRSHNAELTDASDAYWHAKLARAKHQLAILRSYDPQDQTPAQRLSTSVMAWDLENHIQGETFLYHNYPVNQLFGVQNELPTFMATIHHIGDEKDAEHYISRLSKFSRKFDQVLQGLQAREDRGIIPPAFVIEKVLVEMRGFVAHEPSSNILCKALHDKIARLDELEAERKSAFDAACAQQLRDTVYPAYRQLIVYFGQLAGKATAEAGVWKLPNGDAYYAYQLRSYTTTDLSAEQIHALGLKEVERILSEMHSILVEQGYTQGSVSERMQALSKEARFRYPDSDAGREQVLNDYRSIIREIDSGLAPFFNVRPEAPVEVARIPLFKEKTAPGAYYNPPALDKSRPGVFYANLHNMDETLKFGMRTLAYHEAVPGHHFQIAVQQELAHLPLFRRLRNYTAYAEGWALYAERLAWEQGFHSNPYSDLGRLQAELFRAARLVVDTGLHYKRWSREQAIDYMVSVTGQPRTNMVAEVERYIVMPGQACAYKIGQLKILALREHARKTLGNDFDIRDFHDLVLQNGAMPLTILEQLVNEWITERQQAGG